MHLVFEEIVDFTDITDSIFEQLVLNNFEKSVKKNSNLYNKILLKINQTFKEHIGNK